MKYGFLLKYGLRAFAFLGLALAPEISHAGSPVTLLVNPDGVVQPVIQPGDTLALDIVLIDQRSSSAYPYSVDLDYLTGQSGGWGDTVYFPEHATISYPGEVVHLAGSIVASYTLALRSFTFTAIGSTSTWTSGFLYSFYVGSPEPAPSPSPTPVKKKGGRHK